MDVYIDTNMLLATAQHKVDIYSEIDRIVPGKATLKTLSGCITELKKLSTHSTKLARQVKMTLSLIKSKHLKVIRTAPGKTVDDALLALAERGSSIVATQDFELKQRLRAKNITIITLRKKKYLILVE